MDCRIEKGVMLLKLSLNWQWGCDLFKLFTVYCLKNWQVFINYQ